MENVAISKQHLKFLGQKVKDKVTGFVGVGTSVSFDLFGCIQTAVTPKVNKDGITPDGRWFDNNRLQIIGEELVMKVPNFAVNLSDRDEIGPASKPSHRELPTR